MAYPGVVDPERAVLGAILLDERCYPEDSALRADDFSLDSHRRIYSRMIYLVESGRPIDIIALIQELDRHGDLQAVGGEVYVSNLIDGAPEHPHVGLYVTMIRQESDRRKVKTLLERGQRLADNPAVPASAVAAIGIALSDAASTSAEPLPPRFSEEALALRFSQQHRENLRHVSKA